MVWYILRTAMNDKFSYKFKNAQLKEILQMLKEFFGTSEDVSSIRRQSFEKGMKR